MKFRNKLIIYYLTATLLAMLIVGLGVNKTIEYYGMLSLEERLIYQSKSSLDYIKQVLYLRDLTRTQFNGEVSSEITKILSAGNRNVRIYNKKSKLLSAHVDGIRDEVNEIKGIKNNIRQAINGNYSYIVKGEYIYFASPIEFRDEIIGVLEYVYPLDFLYSILSSTSYILILGGGLFAILIIILSLYISKVMVTPIEKLAKATNMYSEKRFNPIDVKGPYEIRRLTDSFNIMGSKIEEYINRQKQFVSNVSHEIRTPLTAIKGYSEYLSEEVKGRDDLERATHHLSRESTRLMDLVNDLLILARMDKGDEKFNFKRTDLNGLIEDALLIVSLGSKDKNISIFTNLEEDINILGDKKKLTQVIINVLDNAIKYSPMNSKVDVILRKYKDKAVLKVKDRGIGIPEGEEDKVFDRFYRSKNTIKFKGTGLGLAISKEIIISHGGRIKILRDNSLGTTIEVTLPLSK